MVHRTKSDWSDETGIHLEWMAVRRELNYQSSSPFTKIIELIYI